MGEISKHIVENQERADNAYWDVYHRLEEKKKELNRLQHDVIWMEKDLEKLKDDKEYYQKLLNELNNGNI